MIFLKFLLDTNILSEPICPEPIEHVLEKLEQHEIATATVVRHEMLFGCQRLPVSRKRQKLEQYLNLTQKTLQSAKDAIKINLSLACAACASCVIKQSAFYHV